ncbi:condensin subunit Smc [Alteribacillus persepolensis]|uniref:Chromosome partition protein Smc n=1 Tax=Alteribacillus persepolensis TaxID=568899 RepID=A0A1G7YKT9_9BACI|nr:chromosome segregation protein SMC [Alteribacillus persepolensis]SDG96859.1 condensin subunit Smc [Alteribacillus persepolensis]
MFLKRLEVKGFKSFAEEMNIEFVPGVNAVVGPNGSGKSNIADGIRWVLGEQSARSLRGAKMEDVIFAGSDTRRSLNLASITVVLDNTNDELLLGFSEVSITRRLYRSGESEYLMNQKPCRRKDIVELFMDSGLGKEAFSIIGQGRVEEVLSSKPVERRAIFEEAAGVVKYKQRKQQAEKKLTETRDNLYRVEDILSELEGQLEPLKQQASAAKDYLTKTETLKEYEIGALVEEVTMKHQVWTALHEEIENIEKQQTVSDKELKQQEEKRKEWQQTIENMEKNISAVQDALVAASEQLEKEEGHRRLLEERGKNAGEKKAEWEKRLWETAEKNKHTKQLLKQQKQQLKQSTKKVKELKEKLKENQSQWQYYVASKQEEIESLKSEYIERLNEQAAIRNEERHIEDQKTQFDQRFQSLQVENDRYLKERKTIEEHVETWNTYTEKLAKEYEEMKQSYQQLQKQWQQAAEESDQQEEKLYEAYRYLDKTKSRVNVLEEMESDYTGFFHGVKEILKARNTNIKGIIGAVAELINVPSSYVTAVETALGGALQHVVTETEKDARHAIQYLKTNKKGRATFLPADVIRPRSLSHAVRETLKAQPGFVAVASEAVEIERAYQHITDNLLGQVVIAETLEAANKMARLSQYKVRFVTLDGDVVNPGGSMSGGAVKQQKHQLLGRQQELQELKRKYAVMQEKTAALEKKVQQLKEQRDKLHRELDSCRQQEEKARTKLEEANEERRKKEAELARSHSRLSLFDRESASLKEELNKLNQRQQVLEENKTSLSGKIAELEQKIATLESSEKQRGEKLEELKECANEWKIELAASQETMSHEQSEVKRIESQDQEEEQFIRSLEKDIRLLNEQLSSIDGGDDAAAVDIDELKEKKAQLTAQLASLRRDKTEAGQELEHLKLRIQRMTTAFNEQQNHLHEQQVELNRLDVELDTKLQELQETHELSFERARQHYSLSIDIEEAKQKIKLLKMDIEELGTINLGSIDELERVSERVSFLTAQKDDLHKAQESLFAVIQEMDEEVRRRFSETYSVIRKHFQETFVELFGGGDADLLLTEPDDLLETGVDIMARPPGKKRQHLSLLSGGEKALTAIALLFSIVKAKPVPFCVLDEVEAALDEANLVRFSEYLRRFSETTQFIVISHRKTTMEAADVLYGITMEESGVSKMVSVRLEETAKLLEETT